MKVKELVGTLNTACNRGTRFYFKSCKSKRSLSAGVPFYEAYRYWGEYNVVTWYSTTNNLIVIFIHPDERR